MSTRHLQMPLVWLYSLAALVIAMTLLGGLTRLTGSGLSITEWAPIRGILPPFTEEDWLVLFQKYQQTPEYLQVNFGMTASEFQNIFWLEYLHRLLGRLIGLAFAIPLLYFAFHSQIPRLVRPWLWGIGALGAAQGIMGWLMVKSGLTHDPWVSPLRLGGHLLLAFALYTALLKAAHVWAPTRAPLYYPRAWGWFLRSLFASVVFYGALVAGWKAGLIYNTFPLMDGQLVPAEVFSETPFFEKAWANPAVVQWIHRLLALTFVASTGILAARAIQKDALQGWHILLLSVALLQLSLGILTLLFSAPLVLALLHQGMAFAVLTLLMRPTP